MILHERTIEQVNARTLIWICNQHIHTQDTSWAYGQKLSGFSIHHWELVVLSLTWSCCWCFGLIVPNRTQPKPVLRANGNPSGPNCRLWRTMWLYTLAPSRMSMWSGKPKSESARQKSWQVFPFLIKWSCEGGKFCHYLRQTAPSTFHWGPEILPVLNDFRFATM